MVFETVLTDVLNKYLRPYVKKLDNSQLKIGVWKGNVSLDKLELKEDLFDELDIPLKIVRSYIGGIKMEIPWKRLSKDPIIVNIDEVYIIVTPFFDQCYDSDKDNRRKQKMKEKQIQKIEEAAKKLKKQKKDKKKDDQKEKPDTFAEKLVSHLVKNLYVKVRDVHVRYEDSVTNISSTIAVGASLSSLELKSTGPDWIPCIVKESASLIFKLVELNCISLYWTTYAQKLSELPESAWMSSMRDHIARPGAIPPAINQYILHPLSAVAHVKLHLKPGTVMDIPMIFGGIRCSDINVSLSENQFKSLMFTLDSFNRYKLNQKYLKYKPVKSVKVDARAWWWYAYNAVFDEYVKRNLTMWSWRHIKEHRHKCDVYTKKYIEKLTSINPSSSLLKELQTLEAELDVFNIMQCRKIAKRKKKKQLPPPTNVKPIPSSPLTIDKPTMSEPPQKKKTSFFSRLKKSSKKSAVLTEGGAEHTSPTSTKSELVEESSEEDRKQFYKAIGYSEDEEYIEFPKEYVAHHIELLVDRFTVELTGKNDKLATIVTHSVNATALHRPSSESISVSASIKDIAVTGIPKDYSEVVMVSADNDKSSNDAVVTFGIEINPLDDPEKDIVVSTSVLPLRVIYDEDTIDRLVAAFRVRKNIHLQELTSAASSTVDQLKAQASAGLVEALQNRKRLEVDIKIHSPYIIVPESGHYTHCVLVVDLGVLSISGRTRDPMMVYKELSSRQTFSSYYDTFFIKLSALQVLVATPDDDWQSARGTKSTSMHILSPTGFSIELRKSIVSDDALLPSLQIIGDLPTFEINLDNNKLSCLLCIILSLKLPPPSLKNTTTYYNELPPPPTHRMVTSDSSFELAKTVSMDTLSVISFGEDEVSTPTSSLRSHSSSPIEKEETSKFIFTDVQLKIKIRNISLLLKQVERKDQEKLLLLVQVNTIEAEINDRSWDLQGGLLVKEVAILDYIAKDSGGAQYSYLLKTDKLTDGNFFTARFVSITQVGQDFANKYTNLNNSASIQISNITFKLHQETLAGLLKFGLLLKPAFDKQSPLPQSSVATPVQAKNLPSSFDVQDSLELDTSKPPKEFSITALFEGITAIVIGDDNKDIVRATVTGFNVTACLKPDESSITASMKDLVVVNPIPDTVVPYIVHKIDADKDTIEIKANFYQNATKGSGQHDLSKVDASLEATVQRLEAHLDSGFLTNVLSFIQKLKLDSEYLLMAYNATTGTANITATALKDKTKAAFRLGLSVTLHAPHVIIPYVSTKSSGTLHIDLGKFTVSNRFIHGYDVLDGRASVVDLESSQMILDRIEITSSNICVYRESWNVGVVKGVAIQNEILDQLSFTALVTRVLSPGHNVHLPDVTVTLNIEDEIRFHLSDEDIQVFVTIALATTKVTDVLSVSSSKPHPMLLPRSRTLTKTHLVPSAMPGLPVPSQVTKLLLELNLNLVSVEIVKGDNFLIKGTSSDISATVRLTHRKGYIKASIRKLGIIDLADKIHDRHKQILSFNEDLHKVINIMIEIPLQKPLSTEVAPLADITVNIGQLQLLLASSFIKRLLDFALSIDINPQLVKSATKVAQDGAVVANELVQEVYVKISVTATAPNVLLPVDDQVAFMFDLGRLEISNEACQVEENVVIDTFGATLRNFKISRVLLSNELSVERIIVHPYSLLANLQRNLCPWNTKYPLISVMLNMGAFTITLGQEDIETVIQFALSITESIVPIIKKKVSGEIAGAVVQGLKENNGQPVEKELGTENKYKKISISVSLPEFHLQIFKDEPQLKNQLSGVQELPLENGLASFQLVAAELSATIYDNKDVDVVAIVKDLALLDLQVHSQHKNTGNRVLQHFTCNPLKAFTGKITEPLFKVHYVLENNEHNIRSTIRDILLLSDLGFIQSIVDYFKALLVGIKLPRFDEPGTQQTVAVVKDTKSSQLQNIPSIKVSADIKDVRVALIENVSTQPQALVLKVSVYGQVKLNPVDNQKQANLNIADLGITTCSFYDLETATSAVLLPCSMIIFMTGPLDNLTAMNINGTFQSLSLKLSPPIVRLIIHAVKSLMQSMTLVKSRPPPAPVDLWRKKPVELSKLWYINSAPLYNSSVTSSDEFIKEDKRETFTLTVEGIELMLETETTERTPAIPVLSFNASAVVQVTDWTGSLKLNGDLQCEASYFNQQHSLWEPIIEPIELSNGRLQQWRMSVEVSRSLSAYSSPTTSVASTDSTVPITPEPKFFIQLTSTDPLQITITRTSVQLIKDLAEAYTKEYGKKVEGNINVQLLSGAPYTVINKLGPDTDLFIKPHEPLKISGDKAYVKLTHGKNVDLLHLKDLGHLSVASLVATKTKTLHCIDLSIGKAYKIINSVSIDTPGIYYYPLIATEEILTPKSGIVVDVSITGAKKTITVRSSIQVHNHLSFPLELYSISPLSEPKVQATIDSDELYSIPLNMLYLELCVCPPVSGYIPSIPQFSWQSVKETKFNTNSVSESDGSVFHFRVTVAEETYRRQRGLPDGIFPHHVFHIYPLSVMQNLLPVDVKIGADDGSLEDFVLKPGDSEELHYVNVSNSPLVFTLVNEEMTGMITFPEVLPEDIYVKVGKKHDTVELSILHEDLGYHRLSIYSAFWIINKTGLMMYYMDDRSGKQYRHPADKDMILLSCENRNNAKIKIACQTPLGSRTEWSSAISLQAVGTSGSASSKLKDACTYFFGIGIQLSKFTLTKLVVITPYYLVANQTSFNITVKEEGSTADGLFVSKACVVPFWPQCNSSHVSLLIDDTLSVMFNYKKTDSLVIKLSDKPVALCVDIQETESANVITVSQYYEGCTPVYFINLMQDATIVFKQDIRGDTPEYTLAPGECIHYTWDDPTNNRSIKWLVRSGNVTNSKAIIDISKDGQENFRYSLEQNAVDEAQNVSSSYLSLINKGQDNEWLSVESSGESLVSIISITSTSSRLQRRGYWKSFIDNLQRTLIFANNTEILNRIKSADSMSQNIIQLSLSIKSIGLSLVDNTDKREVAYIGVTQSGVIWQVSRGRGHWKTLNNTVIALLEEGYQKKELDVRHKDLIVNLESMEMFSPLRGSLRRTNYNGLEIMAGISAKDYSLNVKIGYIDNQLPFAVYPQLLYPLPPPPTVASTVEPKPFFEASVIVHKVEQQNVNHFKYVHVLVQRISLNVDLGFILSLVDFFTFTDSDIVLEPEYLKQDMEFTQKSLQDTVLPIMSDELVKRNLFDVFHISPVKITLSFNVRSVGRNQSVQTVGDRFLQLFLHSLGVILTSVQEAQINFSLFHLEYIVVTWNKLIDLLIKHYRTQGLVQIHRLILGLDVLGNPVKVVRGVVEGTFDLFYEPIKGSVLGPEEFAEGLGIGLRSFFGGTFGGLTGAGARITGAFGDVFAKLSFDDSFIDRRQQEKVKSTKFGSKVGGFFKNVAEGVTGVVVQPIKGVKEEGALGFFKGTGRGLVGLLVRPTGGLIDLTSGALEFVARKTRVGDVEIVQLRPARFIGRDGVIHPYSPSKALGNALLVGTNEGHYTESDSYVNHHQISLKPVKFLIVTDRRYIIIEQWPLIDGWKSSQKLNFKHVLKEAACAHNMVYITVDDPSKYHKASQLCFSDEEIAKEVCVLINEGYQAFKEAFV